MEYRRLRAPGGRYFFTVVTRERWPIFHDAGLRRRLGEAMRTTAMRYPFRTDAVVLLPDHIHCVWSLPLGDADFSGRWRLIKRHVTDAIGRRVWQARFWEHLLRDDADYRNHLDYIHYNPVRHGLVSAPREWRWSSFHRYVRAGLYPVNWGASAPSLDDDVGHE